MQCLGAVEDVEHKGGQEKHLGCRIAPEGLMFREDGLLLLTANLIAPKPHRLDRTTASGDDKSDGQKSGRIVAAFCHQFVDRPKNPAVFGSRNTSCAGR